MGSELSRTSAVGGNIENLRKIFSRLVEGDGDFDAILPSLVERAISKEEEEGGGYSDLDRILKDIDKVVRMEETPRSSVFESTWRGKDLEGWREPIRKILQNLLIQS